LIVSSVLSVGKEGKTEVECSKRWLGDDGMTETISGAQGIGLVKPEMLETVAVIGGGSEVKLGILLRRVVKEP